MFGTLVVVLFLKTIFFYYYYDQQTVNHILSKFITSNNYFLSTGKTDVHLKKKQDKYLYDLNDKQQNRENFLFS